MAACFCRPCSLHWTAWCVSDAEELSQEKAWASQRPGVQKCWEAVAKGEATCITKNKLQMQTFGDDDKNSILACLLPTERKRLEDVRLNHPSAILFDVSQNSSARCRVLKEGSTCFTLVASQGITVFCDGSRWLCASDCCSISGFPITMEHVAAAGHPCIFSQKQPVPASRTHLTVKKQIGNAMHVCHMGAVLLTALVRFKTLGSDKVHQSIMCSQVSMLLPAKREASMKDGMSRFQLAMLARKQHCSAPSNGPSTTPANQRDADTVGVPAESPLATRALNAGVLEVPKPQVQTIVTKRRLSQKSKPGADGEADEEKLTNKCGKVTKCKGESAWPRRGEVR